MAKKRGILYVFDLQNQQDQYAKCLEFISILYNNDNGLDYQEKLNRICDLAGTLEVSGGFAPNVAKNYYEQPLEYNGEQHVPVVSTTKKVEPQNVQPTILVNDPSLLHFHIRIHLHKSEGGPIYHLSNFHYLALFLQRLKQIGQEGLFRRLSVFIVPLSGNYYPFVSADGVVDVETCKVVSRYLRLLSKEYTGIIYGAQLRGSEYVVRALNFQASNRVTDCFPLVPLTDKTYTKLFVEALDVTIFDELCRLKKRQRFQNAADEDPYVALGSFILETAFFNLANSLSGWSVNDKNYILSLISEELASFYRNERCVLIDFSIFLFTLHLEDNNSQMSIENLRSLIIQNLEFATELCAGLRQLAQNTLQHSASHEGVFSFYLDHYEHAGSCNNVLKVYLSDFNNQHSFIDSFVENIREEAIHTDNSELKQCYLGLVDQQEYISLSDFFGEFGSGVSHEAWIDFRKADTSAHVGLLLFSLVMQRCKGQITLINSIDYSITENNVFFHSYSNNARQYIDVPNMKQHFIPGTQLVLTIPIGVIENARPIGMGQLSLPNPLHEDYDTFATYLDCKTIEIEFSEIEFNQILNEFNIGSECFADSKLVTDVSFKRTTVYCWEKYWRRLAKHSVLDGKENLFVNHLNIARLSPLLIGSSDKIEIFIKGFINALDVVCPCGDVCLWAFSNASPDFLRIIRQLLIVLAPKSFPSGLQLYIVETDPTKSIHLLGNSFFQAVANAYMLSLEHGTQAFSLSEVRHTQALYEKIMGTKSTIVTQKDIATRPATLVCPFDVILREPVNGIISIFDKRIGLLAERPIDDFPSGCKLDTIHMRLGSKVHIRSFYEMAFMFYRTAIANRVAFEILKDITIHHNDIGVDCVNDDLLFYGYASYSKALLTSIQEILCAYRRIMLHSRLESEGDAKKKAHIQREINRVHSHIAIASYQHNLQTEFQTEDTELYFDFYDSTLGENLGGKHLKLNKPIKIIQIVPISSTLTTFDKMERKLQLSIKSNYWFGTVARYTVFWVTDANALSEIKPRSETEEKYWTKVDKNERIIHLNQKNTCIQGDITYFMRSPVKWDDPLNCELCYPIDVIGEVPLVETDQTSTVPTQQVRARHGTHNNRMEDHRENDERLLALRNCVSYGHFRRENNHFQFYIETQSYFNRVSKSIPQWLKKMRTLDSDVCTPFKTTLNIIFSPEHTTNVGFAQYVNNYYFMGNAEIVCVNEDKEFRSNFKCEHMALIHTIGDLLSSASEDEDLPVRFYFVDDTIISGDTFYKANSFLHSLIPTQYQNLFPANLFRKCFLLVDRLSVDSKQAYVKDVEKDFISYLHIDLSNMRTQGDSCVACKLKDNAETLVKRSATQNIAEYWNKKAVGYSVHNYNKYTNLDGSPDDKAFRKLILSHIAQNVMYNDNCFFSIGNIYDSILTIFAELLGDKAHLSVIFKYEQLMQEVKKENDIETVNDFLKLISRPFFSFDFKARLQVLTFMLLLAEYIIDADNFNEVVLNERVALRNSPYKAFLFDGSRIEESFRLFRIMKDKYLNTKELQIIFLQECLIDNLVELRSTYLMRKDTMAKMHRFLTIFETDKKIMEHKMATDFWKEYVAGIHKILDCNSDETRSLWLEYLLISGEEYGTLVSEGKVDTQGAVCSPQSIYDVLTSEINVCNDSAFRHFCHELFLQNSRVLFDSLECCQNNHDAEKKQTMEYWTQWQKLDNFVSSADASPSEEEIELFNAVYKVAHSDLEVKKRYDELLSKIIAMAKKKYRFTDTDIALITILPNKSRNREGNTPKIDELDFVSWKLDSTVDSHFNKYEIKSKLITALSGEYNGFSLGEYGYSIYPREGDRSPYMFVSFKSETYPIVPVYMYFSFRANKHNEHSSFSLNLFLRDILSYRNRLLKILKNDFSGDIFPKYAHTAGEKSILAHEKATSHNTTGDDIVTLEIFMDPKSLAKYDILDSNQVLKWLLLHNYTNAQIAKLFNRSYRGGEEYDISANFPVPPPLYPKDVSPVIMRKLSWFERPLRTFSDLRIFEDGRFDLLGSAILIGFNKLVNAKFLVNTENNTYYNIEYFKNIIIDIIISAMKYAIVNVPYLERVDKYIKGNILLRHKELLSEAQLNMLKYDKCEVECEIEPSENEFFDYLVISNRVNRLAHNLFDYEKHNQIIKARLENPIDYADGHMSLLAICQYIEGLWPKILHRKTSFGYVEKDGELFFKTMLPVISKEDK